MQSRALTKVNRRLQVFFLRLVSAKVQQFFKQPKKSAKIMKVTIELTDDIIWALSRRIARGCYDGWYNGAVSGDTPTEEEQITLYEYAFHDGMDYLLTLIEKGDYETDL